MARQMKIEYRQMEEFGKFLELWYKELDSGNKNTKILFDGIGNEIGEMIIDQIPKKLGGGYGKFMADRTTYSVAATQTGFRLQLYGLTESQVEGGKVGKNGEDYNIWAFHEFGGAVRERTSQGSPGKIAIRKDVASVAAVRQLARGFRVEGKAGAIRVLVGALMPRINRMITASVKRYMKGTIGKAADTAARRSGLPSPNLRKQAESYGIADSELTPELIGVVATAIDGKGQTVIQGRNKKGQFTKRLGVAVPKNLG